MPMFATRRGFRLPALVGGIVAASLVLSPLGSAAANADEPVLTISGTAYSVTSDYIYGATVELYGADQSVPVVTADVEYGGSFTIEAPEPGEYRVKANAPDYVSQWWQESDSYIDASPVTVGEAVVAGIDFRLTRPVYTLTGTVTSGESLAPIAGVSVEVRGVNGGYTEAVQTDENGEYEISDLPDVGLVHFIGTDEFAGEWFENAMEPESATPITFDSDRTVDAALSKAGTINGTISAPLENTGTIRPVAEATAVLYTPNGSYITEAATNEDGQYSFSGLSAGTYRLGFSGPGGWTEWRTGFYGGAERLSLSPALTLKSGQALEAIDAKLVPLSVLSGTVTNAKTGEPIDFARLTLRTLDGAFVDDAWVSNGSYAFRDVMSGSYVLQVWDSGEESAAWYGGGWSAASAKPIVVKRGVTLRGLDISLAPAGFITGTVSSSDAVPLIGTRVILSNARGEEIQTGYLYRGQYQFGGVKTGNYRIRFAPPAGRLIGEWWNDKRSRAVATSFRVSAGETLSLGNTDLASVAPGTITGRVTNGAGSEIVVYGAGIDSGDPLRVEIAADGSYSIDDLAPGAYSLYFAGSQAYPNSFGIEPTPLTVRSGRTTVAETVALRPRSVVDVVTSANGISASASIEFYDLKGNLVDATSTSDDGATQISLPRAQYKVRFAGSVMENDLGLVWLGGKSSFASSQVLDLGTEESASISADLPGASSFSATIVDDRKGRPLDSVRVLVWELQPNGTYRVNGREGATNELGRFTAGWLGAGTYKFQLLDDSYLSYHSSWYGGTSQSSALPITFSLTPAERSNSKLARLLPATGTVGVATPSISGTMKVGKKLTARTALVWPASGVKKTYVWYRDGVPITRATASTYTLKPSDAGKEITVGITGARSGYAKSTTLSLPRNTLG